MWTLGGVVRGVVKCPYYKIHKSYLVKWFTNLRGKGCQKYPICPHGLWMFPSPHSWAGGDGHYGLLLMGPIYGVTRLLPCWYA